MQSDSGRALALAFQPEALQQAAQHRAAVAAAGAHVGDGAELGLQHARGAAARWLRSRAGRSARPRSARARAGRGRHAARADAGAVHRAVAAMSAAAPGKRRRCHRPSAWTDLVGRAGAALPALGRRPGGHDRCAPAARPGRHHVLAVAGVQGFQGQRCARPRLLASTTWARSAISSGMESPMGEPLATLPPSVPELRTGRPAKRAAKRCSCGHWA